MSSENVQKDAVGGDASAQSQGAPETPSEWAAFVKPFADAVGKSVEEVTSLLKGVVGEPGSEAIALLRDDKVTPFEEIKTALGTAVPTAVLRSAVAKHLRGAAAGGTAAPAIPTVVASPTFDILPSVPEDGAWLEMLKTGGVLKVNRGTVIAAVRAGLANRTGLFDLPLALMEHMERHAETLDEPAGQDYYKLRKHLTRRSYAEIFEALEIDGSRFATQKKKDELLTKIDSVLWPALLSFNRQLNQWVETWQKGAANPAALVSVFASMAGGAGAMAPALMQPPATDGLRDAAESVIDNINKVFSGVGIPVAMALAWDAQQIKAVLEDSALPMQIGAVNRDQMLKMLGAAVSPDYVRLERNVTRYTLAVMELSNVTAGQQELGYLTSLYMLGGQIPWDKVGIPARRNSVPRASARDFALNQEV